LPAVRATLVASDQFLGEYMGGVTLFQVRTSLVRIWKAAPPPHSEVAEIDFTDVDCLTWRVVSAVRQSMTRRDSGYSRDVEEVKNRTVLVLREKAAATGRRLLVLKKRRTSQNAKHEHYIAIANADVHVRRR
jgi:hypothetical protein